MANSPDFKSKEGLWVMTFKVGDEQIYTISGRRWCNMRSRTNNTGAYQKDKPTYRQVKCGFDNFQSFAEWASCQTGASHTDWQLDKDLLGDGDEYNESCCVFLPPQINCFLVNPTAKRGQYPVGVCWKVKNSKFVANGRDSEGTYKHLGLFSTAESAFEAYRAFKRGTSVALATKWKDKIDPRAYNALMSYQVLITD